MKEANRGLLGLLRNCAVVSVVFLSKAAAARQFYAFSDVIRTDTDSFIFRNLNPR
jgi:hypothetical protein